MYLIATLIFVVAMPAAAWWLIRFADDLLMKRIPQYDPEVTKTRTDVYSMRAAFAAFIVGLAVAVLWAAGILVIGVCAGLRLLGW